MLLASRDELAAGGSGALADTLRAPLAAAAVGAGRAAVLPAVEASRDGPALLDDMVDFLSLCSMQTDPQVCC